MDVSKEPCVQDTWRDRQTKERTRNIDTRFKPNFCIWKGDAVVPVHAVTAHEGGGGGGEAYLHILYISRTTTHALFLKGFDYNIGSNYKRLLLHLFRGERLFKKEKSRRHLHVLGARRNAWSKIHTEEPSTLGANVQNLVATGTRRLGFVHPCV